MELTCISLRTPVVRHQLVTERAMATLLAMSCSVVMSPDMIRAAQLNTVSMSRTFSSSRTGSVSGVSMIFSAPSGACTPSLRRAASVTAMRAASRTGSVMSV